MKITRSSQSAHIPLRFVIALAFCLGGISLTATSFGSWEAPLRLSHWIGAQREIVHAKISLKKQKPGRASMSTSRSATAATPAPSSAIAQGPADPSVLATIASQVNKLGQTVYSIKTAGFDISPPLREVTSSLPEGPVEQLPELELPPWRILRSNQPDPVVQVAPGNAGAPKLPIQAAPSTGFNFVGGVGSTTGGFPPDNNGSIGNDQYVETVNVRYQIWSLNRGTNTATPFFATPPSINTLWSGFPGPSNCAVRNNGDPVVLYDKVANRWVITQFTTARAGGFYWQCVAVSTTADATGTYARYAFAVPDGNNDGLGDFGDYPHYGVWGDAYYVMDHNFASTAGGYVAGLFGAMDRTKMVAGDASATWQVILDPVEGGHLPADLDGFAPPPGDAPGIFASIHGDGMHLYRMKVDWTTPANTVRTLQAVMPTAPASAACGGGNCIPQPQNPMTIDSLGDRLMFRLAYRNYIDHESLVVSHSVDPNVAGVVSGVRWYEFRLSGQPNAVCDSYPCTYQQGTVADAPNGRSRWMPSIGMDGAGNILVAYSATGTLNAVDNHSIRYTARPSTDPLGTMTAPETILFTATRNIETDPARAVPD